MHISALTQYFMGRRMKRIPNIYMVSRNLAKANVLSIMGGLDTLRILTQPMIEFISTYPYVSMRVILSLCNESL